jgi:hypothetical protein
MKKDVLVAWPKDFATDLPMVPPGEFTTFKEYPTSTQPARVRKLPVLRGYFDATKFDLYPTLPAYVGWGSIHLGTALALTFRVQLGSNMLYWLANPADPEVWKVIDTWAAAGTMVLAAEFADAPPLIMRRDFKLSPQYGALRDAFKGPEQTAAFAATVSTVLAKGELKQMATTDIPSYPKLNHVQGCMVRTKHTGGVALMVSDEAPGSNGPIADAVAGLAKAMLQTDKTRH